MLIRDTSSWCTVLQIDRHNDLIINLTFSYVLRDTYVCATQPCFRGLIPLGGRDPRAQFKRKGTNISASPVHFVPKPWWVAEAGRVLGAVSLPRRTNETYPERILWSGHSYRNRYFLLYLPSCSFCFLLSFAYERRAHVQDDYCTLGTRVATAYAISTLSLFTIYQRRESTAEARWKAEDRETRLYPAEDMYLVVSSRRNSGEKEREREKDENWLKIFSREIQSLHFDGDREYGPMEKISGR